MTAKKNISEKYKTVLISYRPDQEQIVKHLQSKRILSKAFQDMLDESKGKRALFQPRIKP